MRPGGHGGAGPGGHKREMRGPPHRLGHGEAGPGGHKRELRGPPHRLGHGGAGPGGHKRELRGPPHRVGHGEAGPDLVIEHLWMSKDSVSRGSSSFSAMSRRTCERYAALCQGVSEDVRDMQHYGRGFLKM